MCCFEILTLVVNNAIVQLNKVTQQNAAAAEEMATSSEELASQAQQMLEMISFFKTKDNASEKNYKQVSNRSNMQQRPIRKNEYQKKIYSGVSGLHKSSGVNFMLSNDQNHDEEFERY